MLIHIFIGEREDYGETKLIYLSRGQRYKPRHLIPGREAFPWNQWLSSFIAPWRACEHRLLGWGAPGSSWFGRSRVGPENVHFSKKALQMLLPWVVLGPFFANHGCLPRLFLHPLSCKPHQSRESPGYGAASLHPHLLLPTGHHHNACGTSHTLGRRCMNWIDLQFLMV